MPFRTFQRNIGSVRLETMQLKRVLILILESLKSHGFKCRTQREPYGPSMNRIPDIVVTEGKRAWYRVTKYVIPTEDIIVNERTTRRDCAG